MESNKQRFQGHRADDVDMRTHEKQPQRGQNDRNQAGQQVEQTQQGQHDQHLAGKQIHQPAGKKPDEAHQGHGKQSQMGQHG